MYGLTFITKYYQVKSNMSHYYVVAERRQTKPRKTHLVTIKPKENNVLKVSSRVVCFQTIILGARVVLGECLIVSDKILNSLDQEIKPVFGL
jgi:hypothetical protein